MNITDVGHMTDESSPEAVDKMLLAVEDEGLAPLEIAEKYTRAVFEDAQAVGIRHADVYAEGDRAHPGDDRDHGDARREGPRLRGGLGQRVLRRHVVPRLRQALRATRWTTSERDTATWRPTRASGTPPTSRCGRPPAPVG